MSDQNPGFYFWCVHLKSDLISKWPLKFYSGLQRSIWTWMSNLSRLCCKYIVGFDFWFVHLKSDMISKWPSKFDNGLQKSIWSWMTNISRLCCKYIVGFDLWFVHLKSDMISKWPSTFYDGLHKIHRVLAATYKQTLLQIYCWLWLVTRNLHGQQQAIWTWMNKYEQTLLKIYCWLWLLICAFESYLVSRVALECLQWPGWKREAYSDVDQCLSSTVALYSCIMYASHGPRKPIWTYSMCCSVVRWPPQQNPKTWAHIWSNFLDSGGGEKSGNFRIDREKQGIFEPWKIKKCSDFCKKAQIQNPLFHFPQISPKAESAHFRNCPNLPVFLAFEKSAGAEPAGRRSGSGVFFESVKLPKSFAPFFVTKQVGVGGVGRWFLNQTKKGCQPSSYIWADTWQL